MSGLRAEQRVNAPVLRAAWVQAAFVHWRLPAESVQAVLPSRLTPDLYDGSAWATLAPHVMADMRPLGLPLLPNLGAVSGSLPDLSESPEINLRTYVRGPDGREGLWFLSLDAANPGVVAAVRGFVGARYFPARLTAERDDVGVRYAGRRFGSRERWDLTIRPGGPIQPSAQDVWLTGRWRAYTKHLGRLMVTPVEHEPWPLQSGTLDQCRENLTASAGIPGPVDPVVHFSEGVTKVRIGVPKLLR